MVTIQVYYWVQKLPSRRRQEQTTVPTWCVLIWRFEPSLFITAHSIGCSKYSMQRGSNSVTPVSLRAQPLMGQFDRLSHASVSAGVKFYQEPRHINAFNLKVKVILSLKALSAIGTLISSFASDGHVKNKQTPPTVAASYCLLLDKLSIFKVSQCWLCSSVDPLWPCIKVKVIEMSMNINI